MKIGVRLIVIPDMGHFEIASPLSTTWPMVRSEVVALLAKRPDELSKTGENHKPLAKLVGTWAYTGKHFPAHAAPNAKVPEFKGHSGPKRNMGGPLFHLRDHERETFNAVGRW